MVDSAPVKRIPTASLAPALLGLCLAFCAAIAAPVPEPTVILISLDGTRPADVFDAGLPTFDELARRGARAERLVPVFPSNTFPNHVSLVTGVAPGVHGIVNNTFRDPERGLFDYDDDPDWILVEPIWSWVGRFGVVSAAFHWVGSEGPWRGGRGPLHWRRFASGTPEQEKVEQILAWLDEVDPGRRPRLLTAWFRGADHAAHEHGPGAEAVRRALRRQDAALGLLLRGLEARGAWASTTLLLVSDHGMASVERRVDLQAALGRADVPARVLGSGGFASLIAEDADAARRAVAVAREIGLEAWLRQDAPPELGVGHPRFGDAVALAPPGTAIERSAPGRPQFRGTHGYRPEVPGMSALFLAVGRGARPGAELGTLRALDVAPTLLALLGLPLPDWMEGRPIEALRTADGLP
jgi:predicted AlkP superfamily pyrophosphatase or phosphodiesterase